MSCSLKKRLAAGEKLFGTMITTFFNTDVPKIFKVCGYDYIVIDCEHGAFTTREVADMIAVARAIELPVMVRIPLLSREHALKFTEMGANGLLMPNTETAEQAGALVDYTKYAPMGHRGVSLSRPHTDFLKVDSKEYMSRSNEENVIMCQIESRKGVENIEEIMAVPGVDVALIGPNDMTQDFGILNQFENPETIDAFNRVIAAAEKNGKFSGVHFGSASAIRPWLNSGMSMLMVNSDLGLLKAGTSELKSLREEIK